MSPLCPSRTNQAVLPPVVGLVLGYASLDEDEIRRGVQMLKAAMDEVGGVASG